MKDEIGNLLADSHSIFSRWKSYLVSFNVRVVNDVRQIEMHMAEPLVPKHSSYCSRIDASRT
jgi:hypothetical protein